MKRKLAAIVVLLVVASISSPSFAAESDVKKVDQPAAGTWKLASLNEDGHEVDLKEREEMKLSIIGKQFILNFGENLFQAAVTANKKDENYSDIDIKPMQGANRGNSFAGILRVKNDALEICYSGLGGQRPTDFKAGKNTRLERWERLTNVQSKSGTVNATPSTDK